MPVLPILILATLLTPLAAAEWLVVCSGQSNMDGRGAVDQLDAAQRAVPANVRYYYKPDPTRPVRTQASFDHRKQFGPVTGFVHAMAAARPADVFVVLLDATGGTALSEWVPDYTAPGVTIEAKRGENGHLYAALTQRIAAVRIAHPAARPLAFLWLQGEADKGALGAFYLDNLRRLAANIRRDLATPELLVVPAEPTSAPPEVFAALRTFVGEDRAAALVECRSLARGLHYDAMALLAIGRGYAEKVVARMPVAP